MRKSVTKKPAAKGAVASKKTTSPTKAPSKAPAKKLASVADPAPAAAKGVEKQDDTKIQTNPIEVEFKAVKDQFVDDKNNSIRKSEFKKPAALLIDREDNIAIRFLRMSNLSWIEALDITNPDKTEEDSIEMVRLSVINALRQGKPMVINLDRADNEVFVTVCTLFKKLQDGLMEKLLDRSIITDLIKDNWHEKLVKDSDGDAFQTWYFNEENMEKFFMVVVTQFKTPSPELKEQFTVFKVKD